MVKKSTYVVKLPKTTFLKLEQLFSSMKNIAKQNNRKRN